MQNVCCGRNVRQRGPKPSTYSHWRRPGLAPGVAIATSALSVEPDLRASRAEAGRQGLSLWRPLRMTTGSLSSW
jgi:hypothetical protein